MSIASLSHSYVFGISSAAAGGDTNLHYVDESTVIYPAGCNIVVADMEQKTQKFVPSSERVEAISTLTVSPDRHIFAVAERSAKPGIVIYDLHSFRKRRNLAVSSETVGIAKDFISLSFSADGKYLAAQLAAPESILHYYSWEKGKLLATITCTDIISNVPIKQQALVAAPSMQATSRSMSIAVDKSNPGLASNFSGLEIMQIAICPNDSCQVSTLSKDLFRVFRYGENGMKALTELRNRTMEFTTHCWCPNERTAIGTVDGRIIIFYQGEIVQDIPLDASFSVPITCLVNMSRGLVASSKSGRVGIFERYLDATTKHDMLKKNWQLTVNEENAIVKNMALSGSEGSLIAQLETKSMYKIQLAWSELMKGEEVKFESVFQPYHHGGITAMDTCIRKPLLVTSSSDKSLRIWNYQAGTCELYKYFPEEPLSVALHPSGLYVLVGFTDKLRLYNVLIDDFRLFKEFGIRGCRECAFSNGGHLFAAAYGNTIQLFSTWTFENIGNLKGHNGKVKSLYWTPDDTILVSAGTDGAVYSWIVCDLKRENEHILKSCSYTSAVCTPDGKNVYAVGSDKTLKEITESTVSNQIESSVILTQIALSHSGRMMFVGTSAGQVRSIKYPFSSVSDDYQEHQAHAGPITRFKISFNDQYLFSCSEDGCIFMYKISDKDDRAMARDRGLKGGKANEFADEILITKSDLEEKTVLMGELQRSLEELKLEHEYQLRLKDMNFNEKLKEITEKYSQEIEALKISTSVLRTEKDKEEVKHEEELLNFKTKHMNELHDIEAKYNQQLMEEYEKFQNLQNLSIQKQEAWQKQMADFEAGTQKQLIDSQHEAEARINQKVTEIARLQAEMQQQLDEFDEIARQNADDIDQEVSNVEQRYEKKVRVEREEGARLKGENGIMRKKFNTLNKDIDDNKAEILRLKEEDKKLKGIIATLDKEISSLKKDMSERDELIQDKERRVYDLKKKNQELEKFKFVLDYRIKELKQQVEPRENEIAEMTDQIKDINAELEILNKQKELFQTEISSLHKSLESSKQLYKHEHRRAQDFTHFCKVFRTDLQDAIQFIQEPAVLKKCVENLHKKYCNAVEDFTRTEIDPEVKREYARQNDLLKEQIYELRHKAELNSGEYRADNIKSMLENQALISEINSLRKSSKGMFIKAKNNSLAKEGRPDQAIEISKPKKFTLLPPV